MSQFRDVIARMAVDAEFARHARSHPDQVAGEYGLTFDETEKLRGLADASAVSGPTALGVRLSKSGITTGGLATALTSGHDLPHLDLPAHGDGGGTPDAGHDPAIIAVLHPGDVQHDGGGHPAPPGGGDHSGTPDLHGAKSLLEIGPKQDDPVGPPPPPPDLPVGDLTPMNLHLGGDGGHTGPIAPHLHLPTGGHSDPPGGGSGDGPADPQELATLPPDGIGHHLPDGPITPGQPIHLLPDLGIEGILEPGGHGGDGGGGGGSAPDLGGLPLGDNDHDGILNMFDPTPDGDPTPLPAPHIDPSLLGDLGDLHLHPLPTGDGGGSEPVIPHFPGGLGDLGDLGLPHLPGGEGDAGGGAGGGSGDPGLPDLGGLLGDSDHDGIPNYLDPTPNGDTPPPGDGGAGLPDFGGLFGDNDHDGIPNFLDPTPNGDPHPHPIFPGDLHLPPDLVLDPGTGVGHPHFPIDPGSIHFPPGVLDPGTGPTDGGGVIVDPVHPGGDGPILGDPPVLGDPGHDGGHADPTPTDTAPPSDGPSPAPGSDSGGGSSHGSDSHGSAHSDTSSTGGGGDQPVATDDGQGDGDAAAADAAAATHAPVADAVDPANAPAPGNIPAAPDGGISGEELAIGAAGLGVGVIAGGVAGGVAGAAAGKKNQSGQPNA
ncbi:hypothetical protein [Hamadaea tsunoensis]|uniref:hypothetical protein n=1 Tax=Hamadaea tsunoensis TaxID=53368 RepID=UPI00047FC43D|nr:hypothetical protein [Hamadaea tsunoensis]